MHRGLFLLPQLWLMKLRYDENCLDLKQPKRFPKEPFREDCPVVSSQPLLICFLRRTLSSQLAKHFSTTRNISSFIAHFARVTPEWWSCFSQVWLGTLFLPFSEYFLHLGSSHLSIVCLVKASRLPSSLTR